MVARAAEDFVAYHPVSKHEVRHAKGDVVSPFDAHWLIEGGAPVDDDGKPTPVRASRVVSTAAPAPAPAVEPEAPAAYDPSQFNVPDVLAYAKAHPEEIAAIVAAERAGKARSMILDALA